MMTKVIGAAPAGMIAMGVCDDSLIYGLPGIDIKIALAAVQTFIGKFDQRHSKRYENNMPEENKMTCSRYGGCNEKTVYFLTDASSIIDKAKMLCGSKRPCYY